MPEFASDWKRVGAALTGTGSRPSDHAPAGHGAARFDPSREAAAEAYNVFFAYYHDAKAWDDLTDARRGVWELIARAAASAMEAGTVETLAAPSRSDDSAAREAGTSAQAAQVSSDVEEEAKRAEDLAEQGPMSDEAYRAVYDLADRLRTLSRENADLKAERDAARRFFLERHEQWRVQIDRAEAAEAKVEALTAALTELSRAIAGISKYTGAEMTDESVAAWQRLNDAQVAARTLDQGSAP